MVSVKGQDPLIPHPAQLCGHGAPVHGEEVRELLPVKGNIKHRTSGSLGLLRKIGQKLFSRRSSGHMLQLPGEHFVLLRTHSQKIADQPPVELTGLRTHGKDPLHIQKKHLARFYGNSIIQNFIASEAGIHFTEYFSL